MKDLTFKDYLKVGFNLGIDSYFKIFFYTILYYIFCYLLLFTIVGILIIPALTASFYKFLLSEARNENISFFELIKQGFKNGLYWKSWLYFLIIFLIYMVALIPGIYAFITDYYLLSFIFYVLSVILILFVNTNFYLSFLLLVDYDKDINPINSLIESSSIVNKLGFNRIFFINLVFFLMSTLTLAFIFIFPIVNMINVGVYINANKEND